MGTSIQPAGQQASLNDLLTARVRGFLAEVLPDEMVKQFADKAVAEFTIDRDEPHPDRWARERGERLKTESEMTKMVREIVAKELRPRIAEQLQQIIPKVFDETVDVEQTRDLAEQVIESMGPLLLKGIVADFAQVLVMSLNNRLSGFTDTLRQRGIQL